MKISSISAAFSIVSFIPSNIYELLKDKCVLQQYQSMSHFSSLILLLERYCGLIKKDSRPVVTVTGSHKRSCIFGAINLEGKQLFRQCDIYENTFYYFLEQI
jgi:hypothetical protein